MNAEQRHIISRLNTNIQQLQAMCEHTKIEVNNLQQDIKNKEVKIEELTKTIEELNEKNKKLLLADAFKASSEDTRDAKMKIGRIVREIDKCMALLNN